MRTSLRAQSALLCPLNSARLRAETLWCDHFTRHARITRSLAHIEHTQTYADIRHPCSQALRRGASSGARRSHWRCTARSCRCGSLASCQASAGDTLLVAVPVLLACVPDGLQAPHRPGDAHPSRGRATDARTSVTHRYDRRHDQDHPLRCAEAGSHCFWAIVLRRAHHHIRHGGLVTQRRSGSVPLRRSGAAQARRCARRTSWSTPRT